MTDEERTPEWLDRMIELIDLIDEELQDKSLGEFVDSRNVRDLAGFRLSQLGEISKKLPQTLRDAHPMIDWAGMRSMRNFVVHEYHRVDWKAVFVTATTKLGELRTVCAAELARREP